MNEHHFKHWTEADKEWLAMATSFEELAEIALAVLGRFPGKVEMVSGPISTGGVGSVEGNRRVFARTIDGLVKDGHEIFDQWPFESKLAELSRAWLAQHPEDSYCYPILEDFYRVIFDGGKISTIHFIPGWETSTGARWEHDHCDRYGIERNYLPRS